jgi:hypothetical protein
MLKNSCQANLEILLINNILYFKMDALLLIILIFAIIVMLGISIYLLVIYVHRK